MYMSSSNKYPQYSNYGNSITKQRNNQPSTHTINSRHMSILK